MGCCSSDLSAAEQSPRLKVGDHIPDFVLKRHDGSEFSSIQALEDNHLVISFYRGHWCPFCNRQLSKLQKRVDEIAALGATIVAICPGRPKYVQMTVERHNLTFPAVSDPNNLVAKKFGIVHRSAALMAATHSFDDWNEYFDEKVNAMVSGPAMTPHPCTYIVERKTGRILEAHVQDADTITRMSPDDIVAFLKTLKNKPADSYAVQGTPSS